MYSGLTIFRNMLSEELPRSRRSQQPYTEGIDKNDALIAMDKNCVRQRLDQIPEFLLTLPGISRWIGAAGGRADNFCFSHLDFP